MDYYVSFGLRNSAPRIFVVGRLIDGYLTLIAKDTNLTAKNFQLVAAVLPKSARHCDDNLYRAMDIYLKVCKLFAICSCTYSPVLAFMLIVVLAHILA